MSVDRATFLANFPEFNPLAESKGAAIDRQLRLASQTLNSGRLGMWYDDVCFLWAAHYLYLRYDISTGLDAEGMNDQENTGVTTSQSANTSGLSSSTSVSALVSSENAIEADFSRTEYGLEYLSLLKQVFAPGVLC